MKLFFSDCIFWGLIVHNYICVFENFRPWLMFTSLKLLSRANVSCFFLLLAVNYFWFLLIVFFWACILLVVELMCPHLPVFRFWRGRAVLWAFHLGWTDALWPFFSLQDYSKSYLRTLLKFFLVVGHDSGNISVVIWIWVSRSGRVILIDIFISPQGQPQTHIIKTVTRQASTQHFNIFRGVWCGQMNRWLDFGGGLDSQGQLQFSLRGFDSQHACDCDILCFVAGYICNIL